MADPLVVTEHDIKDQNLLLRFLRRVSQRIGTVDARLERIENSPNGMGLSGIRQELQATGVAPLRIDNLRGETADPQKAKVVTYTSTPTGQALQGLSDGQLVVVSTGTGDALYRVVGGNPNRLVQLNPSSSGGSISVADANFEIYDDGDNTKKLKFQASGITAGATRTLTPPNYDGTIATLAGTETLTNKTLTTPTIGSFANATHNHSNAAGGGQLTGTAFVSATGTGAIVMQTSPEITTPTIKTIGGICRAVSDASLAPTATVTGAGATPTLTISAGSSDMAVSVSFTPGGAGIAALGTVVLTFSTSAGGYGSSNVVTVAGFRNGSGTWDPRATAIVSASSITAITIKWDNNGVVLTAGSSYILNILTVAR